MWATLLGFHNDLSKVNALDIGFLLGGFLVRALIGEWLKDEVFPFFHKNVGPSVNKGVKIMAKSTMKEATPHQVLGWASRYGLQTSEGAFLLASSLFVVVNDSLDLYHQIHIDPTVSIWVLLSSIAYAFARSAIKLVSIWKISLPVNVSQALEDLSQGTVPVVEQTVTTTTSAGVSPDINYVTGNQPTLPEGYAMQPTEPPIAPFAANDIVIE
jgi:hypothetical protein